MQVAAATSARLVTMGRLQRAGMPAAAQDLMRALRLWWSGVGPMAVVLTTLIRIAADGNPFGWNLITPHIVCGGVLARKTSGRWAGEQEAQAEKTRRIKTMQNRGEDRTGHTTHMLWQPSNTTCCQLQMHVDIPKQGTGLCVRNREYSCR